MKRYYGNVLIFIVDSVNDIFMFFKYEYVRFLRYFIILELY